MAGVKRVYGSTPRASSPKVHPVVTSSSRRAAMPTPHVPKGKGI